MRQDAPVITIDGASGTGKGVVTHLVANALGWKVLDSGVLYRALAMAAQKHQIPFDDEAALTQLAQRLDVVFTVTTQGAPSRILLENQDVTESIRTESVGNAASKIGVFPAVREALLARQRAFCELPGLVADGRDMGTVVFPNASLKIFLTASPEERARRRHKQLKENSINVNLSDLIEELRERDRRDRERTVAPLKPADDAICIDTDDLTIEQVVQLILSEVERIFPKSTI